ncbi:restriction endonuclease subunit S [Desulfonatronum parangueonense]
MSASNKNMNSYFSIPDDWNVAALPDVVFFQEGPGLRKWQWTEYGMKVINVTNILGDGRIDTKNTSRYISIEEFQRTYQHFAVDAEDIVIASSGNTYGKVGRISEKDLPLMMNTSVIRLRSSDNKRLNSDFLYAFLRSDAFRNQMESFVIGSAQPNFGPTHLKRMVMPLPPLPTQRKIASILSAYDNLIENNQRRIKILEEISQNLYREWFVKFRFPGHQKVKFVDSPLGRIPEGWMVVKMPDAVNIRPSIPIPKHERFVFVSMGNLSENSMLINGFEYRNKASGARFQNGDTLFARITPCLENGKTGFVQILQNEMTVACGSTEFIVLRSKTVTPEYVYLMARSDDFRDNAIKSMTGASGRQRVSEKCFDGFHLAQPSSDVLSLFQAHTSPQFKLIHTLSQKNSTLRRTRDLLLPKLISGEIDVSDLEIAVPEEVEA